MKRRTAVASLVTILLAGSVVYWLTLRNRSTEDDEPFTASQTCGPVVSAQEYKFSGPYVHDNITVFLIHGRETLNGVTFLTLDEALTQKDAVLHETGTVSELAIENLSSKDELFVQSGDIVKGGKQDRTLPYDTLIQVQSGKVPIASFCVEQSRWTQRGKESYSSFSSSNSNLSTTSLKKAAKAPRGAQGEVWKNVANVQERLEKKIGKSVQDEASKSSLQLTMENPLVQQAIAPYRAKLLGILDGKSDAIGYAVAINGQIVSADIYASPALFRKLWPKLVESSAIEAFIESEGNPSTNTVAEPAVQAFMTAAESGTPRSESVTTRTYLLMRKSPTTLLYDCCDRNRGNLVLHRSVLADKE